MKKEYKNMIEMINSPDKENLIVVYNILKSPVNIFNKKEQKDLLNKIDIFDRGSNYKDICWELKEDELTISDFKFLSKEYRKKSLAQAKLQQIEKFFKGGFKFGQKNYYPYFEKNSAGRGLAYHRYLWFDATGLDGMAAYFHDDKTAIFVGKTFIDIYNDLI